MILAAMFDVVMITWLACLVWSFLGTDTWAGKAEAGRGNCPRTPPTVTAATQTPPDVAAGGHHGVGAGSSPRSSRWPSPSSGVSWWDCDELGHG